MEKQLKRAQAKLNCINVSKEDSIRASELEVENEKLHKDILLLRSSINRGVENQELEFQFIALEEENKRRLDECIQLRSILAQRSQAANNFSLNSMGSSLALDLHENELMQAFQAQKHVNRQLESELTALNEENSARIYELNQAIDEQRTEKGILQEILHDQIRMNSLPDQVCDVETQLKHQQNIQYLLHEVETGASNYAETVVCSFTVNALTFGAFIFLFICRWKTIDWRKRMRN